jgi:hypothetical protein
MDTFIGDNHPQDGRQWDCQCARCGSSLEWEPCGACGGEGITAPGELYELDPLWYSPDDYSECHQCGGDAAYQFCVSSPEWCEAHPIIGRESIASGTPEWFAIPAIYNTNENQAPNPRD